MKLFHYAFMVATIGLIAATGFADDTTKSASSKPNVLFIAIDDLRPELGVYGNKIIKTPNIDGIASKGTTFQRAYCQYSLCNPSRSSMLSGLRPETLKIYDLGTHVDTNVPDVVTLPEHFKNNGYQTYRYGKIFHVGHGNVDRVQAWTSIEPPAQKPPEKKKDKPQAVEAKKKQKPKAAVKAKENKKPNPKATTPNHSASLPYGDPDVPDNTLTDGINADAAIAKLKSLDKEKPFFLAVGFHKPHLPFIAPKKYWDMYNPDEIPLATNNFSPKDAPPYANNDLSELRRYRDVPSTGPITEKLSRKLKHGYFASTSYVDAQIGRIISELDALKLRENTIIVVWGDHGYQLGEHATWNKRTNWETGTRIPLIISAPGQKNPGTKTNALVELVDVYPTLADLAGLEPPKKSEGTSLSPLIKDPAKPWKNAIFSCMLTSNVVLQDPLENKNGNLFGRAIRTDDYRLVEWVAKETDKPIAYELYDQKNDPDENTNIAKRTENAELVKQLTDRLHKGWKEALPPK